jgi:hypothetical protein
MLLNRGKKMSNLNISEIEFNAIKENLKTYFKSQSEFTDYNFEASGLSILLDALAYTIHYLSFYLNTAVTESFLDSAILRKNINSHAKALNYLPRRKSGAEAIINIDTKSNYIPFDTSTIITIPVYANFISNTYNFFTKEEYQLTNTNSYSFDNIVLRQGLIKEYIALSSGLVNQEITIQNANIDNDIFNIYVDDVLWTHDQDLTDINETSLTYSLEMTDDNYVKIIFGDGILGSIPVLNAEIKVVYSETLGLEGNNYSNFSLNSILEDNYSNTYDNSMFTITTVEQSLGGNDEESIDSIKLNAPKFYASQDRLVNKSDYESFLEKNAIVQKASVWGGDEDTEIKYGTVYMAIKPNNAENLTSNQKTEILEYLNSQNILSINLEFKDINYVYVNVEGTIYYKSQYESTLNITRSDVETAISNFFTNLDVFNGNLEYSRLITDLRDLERIGNVTITIKPYFKFVKNPNGAYNWNLGNALKENSVICNIIYGSTDEGFYSEGTNIKTNKSGNAIIGSIDNTLGTIEIYPGYSITESNINKVYFETENEDIKYQRNNSILPGINNLVYSRYV